MPAALPAPALAALVLTITAACLPLPSTAQVVRCTDPATGKVTYTDGDCGRGQAAREVEARKTPQEIQQEREQAAQALQRKQDRQQQALQQRQSTAPAPTADPPRAAAPAADPAQSADCQRARKNLQDVLATLGRGMYDEQTRLDAAQRQADLACLSPADYARAESARTSSQASPVPYAVPYPAPYSAPHWGAYPHPPRPHPAPPPAAAPGRPAPPPGRDITHCNVFRCYDRQGNTYPR